MDAVRGVAISLVIIGHLIQFGSHDAFDYFANPLFVAIYAFHMPLFAAVSGFLMGGSLTRSQPAVIFRRRVQGLMVPLASWTLLTVWPIRLLQRADPLGSLVQLFIYPAGTLWFLWYLLCSVSVVVLCSLAGRFRDVALLVSVVVFFFVPGGDFLAVGQVRWLHPFFVLGVVGWSRREGLRRLARSRWLGLVAAVGFATCLVLWRRDFSVYQNPNSSISGMFAVDLVIWALRYAFAAFGIWLTLAAVSGLKTHGRAQRVLAALGVASLGIYGVQTPLMRVLMKLPTPAEIPWVYFAVYLPIASLVVLAGCYFATTRVLDRYRITRMLFLGGR